MLHHHFELGTILDIAGVTRVVDALRAVPGVDAVNLVPGQAIVGVRFDQARTSPRELGLVLAQASTKQEKRHGHGSCCGSCGG